MNQLGSTFPRHRVRPGIERIEPWRDWAILASTNHGLLLTAALLDVHGVWLLAIALPLGMSLATATLTVLHDAGHRRFSRRTWVNVLATQTAAPIGLWVAHWTRKHQVHHRVTQVYPLDDATRSSGLVRLHPSAPRWKIHRYQHIYAWLLYGLAWAGELRSQLTYVRIGSLTGIVSPPARSRAVSFVGEKLLCAAVLAPYIWLLGPGRLALLLLVAMTVGSVLAAIVLVVGHINSGLSPATEAPEGRQAWARPHFRLLQHTQSGRPLADERDDPPPRAPPPRNAAPRRAPQPSRDHRRGRRDRDGRPARRISHPRHRRRRAWAKAPCAGTSGRRRRRARLGPARMPVTAPTRISPRDVTAAAWPSRSLRHCSPRTRVRTAGGR